MGPTVDLTGNATDAHRNIVSRLLQVPNAKCLSHYRGRQYLPVIDRTYDESRDHLIKVYDATHLIARHNILSVTYATAFRPRLNTIQVSNEFIARRVR